MENKRWLTIHFMDDTEKKFDFLQQDIDPINISSIISKTLKESNLVLEVEGVMYVFPYSNIKYIRVSPCPEKLPDTVIKGVREME